MGFRQGAIISYIYKSRIGRNILKSRTQWFDQKLCTEADDMGRWEARKPPLQGDHGPMSYAEGMYMGGFVPVALVAAE